MFTVHTTYSSSGNELAIPSLGCLFRIYVGNLHSWLFGSTRLSPSSRCKVMRWLFKLSCLRTMWDSYAKGVAYEGYCTKLIHPGLILSALEKALGSALLSVHLGVNTDRGAAPFATEPQMPHRGGMPMNPPYKPSRPAYLPEHSPEDEMPYQGGMPYEYEQNMPYREPAYEPYEGGMPDGGDDQRYENIPGLEYAPLTC